MDNDKHVDAVPVEDNPVPQSKPVEDTPVEQVTLPDEPAYTDQLPPAGTEANVNVIAEDSEEADFSKDQEPTFDDEPVEDVKDEELDLSGPGTEGA